jgi:hypothetical protein
MACKDKFLEFYYLGVRLSRDKTAEEVKMEDRACIS